MQRPLSEQEKQERNRALTDLLRGPKQPGKPAVNLGTVLTLDADGELDMVLNHRQRRFRVPPVGFRDGLVLAELQAELQRLEENTPADARERVAQLRAELAVLKDAAALMHRLIRPLTWWDRLTWRWRGNPFTDVEAAELQRLFGFFCSARTSSRLTWNWNSRAPSRYLTVPPSGLTSARSTRP